MCEVVFLLHDMHELSFICSFLWKSMLEWVSSKRWKSEFLSERWKCQQVIPRVCSLIKFHLVVLSDNIDHHHHNMIICYFLCVFRADKIPAAQYSSYMESCQKQRQQNSGYSFKGPLTLLLLSFVWLLAQCSEKVFKASWFLLFCVHLKIES